MSEAESFDRTQLRRGIGVLPEHLAAGIVEDIRTRESEDPMADGYPKDTIDAKLEAIEARMDARVDKTLARVDALVVEMQAERQIGNTRYDALNQRISDSIAHLSNTMTWGFSIIGIIIAIATIALTAVTLLAG